MLKFWRLEGLAPGVGRATGDIRFAAVSYETCAVIGTKAFGVSCRGKRDGIRRDRLILREREKGDHGRVGLLQSMVSICGVRSCFSEQIASGISHLHFYVLSWKGSRLICRFCITKDFPQTPPVCIHVMFQSDSTFHNKNALPSLSSDLSCVALEASVETQYAPPSTFLHFISRGSVIFI